MNYHDQMERSTIERLRENMQRRGHLAQSLINSRIERVKFNPADPEHRASYRSFREKGKWTINFYVEQPFNNVLRMIEMRLIDYATKD